MKPSPSGLFRGALAVAALVAASVPAGSSAEESPTGRAGVVIGLAAEVIPYGRATIDVDTPTIADTRDVGSDTTLGLSPSLDYCGSAGSTCIGVGVPVRSPNWGGVDMTEVDYNLRLSLRDFPDLRTGDPIGGVIVMELGYATASGAGAHDLKGFGFGLTAGLVYQITRAFAATADVGVYVSRAPFFHVPIRIGAAVTL